jgi:TolB-like protein
MASFVKELRRRRVFRAAGIYIVIAWVAVQVASLVFPAVNIADAAIRYVWIGILLAFPLFMVFAWRYDVTADGIVRTPAVGDDIDPNLRLRRSDHLIFAALIAVTAVISYQLGSDIWNFKSDQAIQTAAAEPDANSIAILPLENMSDQTGQQYFVEGMHEALIAGLSRISALKVISRTSSMHYKDSQKSLRQIGLELGAAHIIEGSVYRVDNDARITVKLIETSTDELKWTQSYERKLVDILRLQNEVARSIADEVQVLLTAEEDSYFSSTQQVNPEAYEDYLKGRFHWYKFTPQDLRISLEYFQAALDKDPAYALAYVGYADTMATLAHMGLKPATDVFPRAIALVEKALHLDPLLAEAYDLSARLKFTWNHDWSGAENGFLEAIRLKPSHPDAHIVYSQLLGINGRWQESLTEVLTGLQLDPLNDWFRMERGQRLAWMGDYDDALAVLLPIAEARPNWSAIQKTMWKLYFYRGELADSLQAASRYYELTGRAELAKALAGFDAELEYENSMSMLATKLLATSPESYVGEVELARIFACAGDLEQSLYWLEMAFENRDTQLVYTAAEPLFKPVWDHSRYIQLRQKMNLPARASSVSQSQRKLSPSGSQ